MSTNKTNFIYLIIFFCLACTNEAEQRNSQKKQDAFSLISPSQSGIAFINDVVQNSEMNLFTNQYSLNGGGVAVGDLNNDELPDVYFVANQNENALYINKGSLRFQNTSKISGAIGKSAWSTGVSIVDINSDGWNDIYVCYAGNSLNAPENRSNELFINNGDANQNDGIPTFTERANQFGLASQHWSVQALFFDYDRDNDLDLFLVNHPYNFYLPFELRLKAEKDLPNDANNQLFKNNGNQTFTDVSYESGVADWAFGLSASLGDLNQDGWPDIYVANDYSEKDAYLLNQQNGSFLRAENLAFNHISNFSMGSDIADFNNDLLLDVFVLDMMAEDNRRKKVNMSAMKPSSFWDNVANNRHYQYMQNTLQINNGNNHFSEIAELANIAYTDWSWSAIFSDLDNDGWKDLYISNGLAKDFRNADFNKKVLSRQHTIMLRKNFQHYLDQIPEEAIPNYVFRNTAELSFENKVDDWNLHYSGFSNGMAIADLDRDGDLDILLNNLQDTAIVYRNNNPKEGNYLQIQLIGPKGNVAGIGSEIRIFYKDEQQLHFQSLAKGFQSSADALVHFGLGNYDEIDLLTIAWPDGKSQELKNINANQLIQLSYSQATTTNTIVNESPSKWFSMLVDPHLDLKSNQREVIYDDYEKEILLPHKYSQLGPFIESGDLNGDGLDDFMIGGSAGNPAQIYFQNKEGEFILSQQTVWKNQKQHEDMGIAFFDADGDQDLDIYVARGSNEWKAGDNAYQDGLFINDGNGQFEARPNSIPRIQSSSSCVKPNDVDNDGDLDLFIGGRLIPGHYPFPASSQLLINDGGKFSLADNSYQAVLNDLGMVTDAQWLDIDKNGFDDLVIIGEWMPILYFLNDGKGFKQKEDEYALKNYSGWWYSLDTADIDNDGDVDLFAGNLGENSKYKASFIAPFQVYAGDLDSNGKNDIILGYFNNGISYPVRGRSCSSEQLKDLKSEFPSYESFANSSLKEVYGKRLKDLLHLEAKSMTSAYLENQGNGNFKVHSLPKEAQISSINSMITLDVNSDSHLDIVLAGNLFHTETETKRQDASYGQLLLGNGKGEFRPVPWSESGLQISGDVKDMAIIKLLNGKRVIISTRNNGPVKMHLLNE